MARESEDPQALVVYEILPPYKKALVMEFFAAPEASLDTIKALTRYMTKTCKEAGCQGLWCLGIPYSRKAKMLGKSGFWCALGNFFEKPLIMVRTNKALYTRISLRDMDVFFGTLLNYE